MRFDRTAYTKTLRPWTPRRIAAAKRAVTRELDNNALTPELTRFSTLQQRQTAINTREQALIKQMRQFHAQTWREARRLLAAQPRQRRLEIIQAWDNALCPAHPTHFHVFLKKQIASAKNQNPLTTV